MPLHSFSDVIKSSQRRLQSHLVPIQAIPFKCFANFSDQLGDVLFVEFSHIPQWSYLVTMMAALLAHHARDLPARSTEEVHRHLRVTLTLAFQQLNIVLRKTGVLVVFLEAFCTQIFPAGLAAVQSHIVISAAGDVGLVHGFHSLEEVQNSVDIYVRR